MTLTRESSFHGLENCQTQGSPSHSVHFSDTTHILHYDDSSHTDRSGYESDVTYDIVNTNFDGVLNDVDMLMEESMHDKFAQDTFTQELTEALEQLEQMELELEQQQANHHISSNREPPVVVINERSRNVSPFLDQSHNISPKAFAQVHNSRRTSTVVAVPIPVIPITLSAVQQYDIQQYERRDMDVASHIMERLELVEMSLNKHKVDFDDLVKLNDKLQEEMSVLQIRARRYRAPLLYRSNKSW